MLALIRKISKTWVVKILFFGVLIVSFGLWGITDYLNPNQNRDNVVAVVGGDDIMLDTFKNYYDNQLRQLNMGQITPEMAKTMNIGGLVLDQYIMKIMMEKRIKELKLTPDNQILAGFIKKDKAFANPDGSFSAEKFRQILAVNNLTENQLLQSVGAQIAQGWLYESATPQFFNTPNLAKLLQQSRFSSYNMEYAIIKARNLQSPPKPNIDELKQYYQKNAEQYRTAQMRSGAMVRISIDDISKKTTITDGDIEKYFNDNPDQFSRPRTISFDQLLFDNEADATKALAQAKTTEFDKINVGKFTKLDKITTEQAQFAELGDEFNNLTIGAISPIKKTNFGYVIIKIRAIDAGGKISLVSVKNDIANRLKTERAIDELNQITKRLEKQNTLNIQDLANQYGVKYQLIPFTDRTGTMQDGKKFDGFYDELYKIFFQLKAGASDILEQKDAIYMVNATEIKESAIPEYDKIADKIAADWLAQQYLDNLEQRVREWQVAVANGAKLEKIANDNNGNYKIIPKVQYHQVLQDKIKIENIAPHFAFKPFKTSDNKTVYVQYMIQGDFAILTNLIPSQPNEKFNDNTGFLQNIIAKTLAQEFQQGYVAELKRHYKVVVKPQTLERIY